MVWRWIELDQAAGFTGKVKLATTGWPESIAAWIAHACHVKWRPPHLNKEHPGDLNVGRFAADFAKWWRSLQVGRDVDVDSFIGLTRSENADWEGVKVYGQNGMVSIIVALAWWREAVEAMPVVKNRDRQEMEEQRRQLREALGEVEYALGEIQHNS